MRAHTLQHNLFSFFLSLCSLSLSSISRHKRQDSIKKLISPQRQGFSYLKYMYYMGLSYIFHGRNRLPNVMECGEPDEKNCLPLYRKFSRDTISKLESYCTRQECSENIIRYLFSSKVLHQVFKNKKSWKCNVILGFFEGKLNILSLSLSLWHFCEHYGAASVAPIWFFCVLSLASGNFFRCDAWLLV